MVLDVVSDVEGFDALRSEWNEAAEASADPNVFLTWAWLRTWWRHFGESRDDRRLHVVTLRDQDGLVAAAPLFRAHVGTGPVRASVLRPISFDAGDYGGMLLVRRHDEAVRLVADHLAEQLRHRSRRNGQEGQVQAVVLSRLPSDSTALARLREQCPAAGLAATGVDLGDACPFADVREGYNLNKHLKKHKVRQRMRRLSEKYEVSFESHSGPTLDEGLEALVEMHRRRWEGREEELQGLLSDGGQEEFLLDAIRALDAEGWLRLLTLSADGRPVTVELDFEFARRVYMFKGAFDPEFAEFSPGQLTHYRVFEDGIARGVEEFDFMRGDHPYKRRWTNADRRLVTLTLTRPGLAGRLARHRLRGASALQARSARTPEGRRYPRST